MASSCSWTSSRTTGGYPIHAKSEVAGILDTFKVEAERHFRQTLGELAWPTELASVRSDGETVNTCAEVRAWCDLHSIRQEISAPYCQWQNGKVERAIQTAWQGSEAMRKYAGAPPSFWIHSLLAFVHIRNLLAMGDDDRSPWELWNSTAVPLRRRLAHLRVWGSKCYAHVPAKLRKKLGDKARVCVFIGYDSRSKAYLALDLEHRVVISTPDMVFDEACLPFVVRPDLVVPAGVELPTSVTRHSAGYSWCPFSGL